LIGIALELLKLTFVRPGNIVAAEWSEFDLDDEMMWTIPFKKLKQRAFREGIKELKGKSHYVPLSRQAVALLRNLQVLTGQGAYLFPNAENPTGHITVEGLESALNDLGYKGCALPARFPPFGLDIAQCRARRRRRQRAAALFRAGDRISA
jgi:integrase